MPGLVDAEREVEERQVSAAWISTALGDCRKGVLTLDASALSFADDGGAVVLAVPRSELRVRFPWFFWNEGFRVIVDRGVVSVFFGDPRTSGQGDLERVAYRRWRAMLAFRGTSMVDAFDLTRRADCTTLDGQP